MQSEHKYHVVAWWASGRTGLVKTDSAPNAIHFTAPPEFGGLEGRWTPEDIMLAAIASCFTATFNAVAVHSKFEFTDLEVATEGTVSRTESGYSFTEVVLRPRLKIPHEADQSRALALLQKAKKLCLVARALEVPQKFEPCIETIENALVG